MEVPCIEHPHPKYIRTRHRICKQSPARAQHRQQRFNPPPHVPTAAGAARVRVPSPLSAVDAAAAAAARGALPTCQNLWEKPVHKEKTHVAHPECVACHWPRRHAGLMTSATQM